MHNRQYLIRLAWGSTLTCSFLLCPGPGSSWGKISLPATSLFSFLQRCRQAHAGLVLAMALTMQSLSTLPILLFQDPPQPTCSSSETQFYSLFSLWMYCCAKRPRMGWWAVTPHLEQQDTWWSSSHLRAHCPLSYFQVWTFNYPPIK